jgi:hypothetical protein
MNIVTQSIDQKIESLGKKIDFAKKLWIFLSAAVVLLFGAGVFYAESMSDYRTAKNDLARALDNSNKALSELDTIKKTITPGFTPSQVRTFTVTYPEKRKNLGSNRICALSRVQNNTHTNSNCECGLSQDVQGWVMFVQNNQTDTSCSCDVSCIQ